MGVSLLRKKPNDWVACLIRSRLWFGDSGRMRVWDLYR